MASVLAKVQKEIGPNASISSAQKVRSGGVGGFFAREKFEVIVEIPDATTPTVPTTSDDENYDPIASLLGLAEKINKEDINEIKVETPQAKVAQPKVAQPQVAEKKAEQAKMETATAQPETAPQVLIPDEPKISTETDSFAEVLSRVAFQAHAEEESTPESIPGRPAFLDARVIEPEPEPEVIEPKPVVAQEQPEHRNLPEVVPQNRTRISDHPLAALGLPTEYIPVGVGMEHLQESLTSALERLLPKVPEIRASKGSVICVVGERFDAMGVAEELAAQFGRPTEEIILASQTYKGKGAAKVLRTIRDAEDSQRSWSRRPRPTIVAIEANPGSRDASWAEHVLTALEPIATYGVADATRKSDDIKAWTDALGGVDCLAINNVEETVSPAAVLATGIPIDRVDGRRVSPAFWALLLTERLLAA